MEVVAVECSACSRQGGLDGADHGMLDWWARWRRLLGEIFKKESLSDLCGCSAVLTIE